MKNLPYLCVRACGRTFLSGDLQWLPVQEGAPSSLSVEQFVLHAAVHNPKLCLSAVEEVDEKTGRMSWRRMRKKKKNECKQSICFQQIHSTYSPAYWRQRRWRWPRTETYHIKDHIGQRLEGWSGWMYDNSLYCIYVLLIYVCMF